MDFNNAHEWDGEEEPDCWVVASESGTIVAGPFGTEEQAEEAADGLWPAWGWEIVPIMF